MVNVEKERDVVFALELRRVTNSLPGSEPLLSVFITSGHHHHPSLFVLMSSCPSPPHLRLTQLSLLYLGPGQTRIIRIQLDDGDPRLEVMWVIRSPQSGEGVDDRFLILIWLGSSVTSIAVSGAMCHACGRHTQPALLIRWLTHITQSGPANVTCLMSTLSA